MILGICQVNEPITDMTCPASLVEMSNASEVGAI